jgi:leucine dehydrogenase
MLEIRELSFPGFERVVEAIDQTTGLHAFIAIHNTVLGPAMGGTRVYPYRKPEEALEDVLRLAKGMTYKSAVVENGLGGGKSVIIANPKTQKTEKLLLSFGEAVNAFNGSYIVAEDVGTSTEDMIVIRKSTPYVAALPTEKSSGDPSRFTAWGVYRGMQAVAMKLWNNPSLRGKLIAVQGIGHVGSRLTNLLFWDGAELILTDLDKDKVHDLALKDGAKEIHPDKYIDVECDILAPCALGGILNKDSIPRLRCKAVAGAANNQLLTEEDGQRLMDRGILYAPDYIINSGGIINASAEFERGGYNPKKSRDKVNKIYDTLMEVFEKSKKEGKPTNLIADELAEYKLKHGIGKRKTPIRF